MIGSIGEDFNFDRIVMRMKRIMAGLGIIGTIVFFIARGQAWGLGFLMGAVIAWFSFGVTHRFVMAIGAPGEPKPAKWQIVLLSTRYALIAGVVYVMMKLLGLNLLAAVLGLLTAAAAALLEILYELIHGRT